MLRSNDLTQPGLSVPNNSRGQGRNSVTKPLPGMDKTLDFMPSTGHECTHWHKVRDVVPLQVSVKRKDWIEEMFCSGAGLVVQIVNIHSRLRIW